MKISKGLLSLISYSCLIISFPVIAKTNTSLVSPKKGVICDQYICVNNKGVSKSLTAQYLGTQKANKVFSQGDFDHSAFTFSNGVFFDTNTKRCHIDRYFDNGHRSKVNQKITDQLFNNK
ncbi:YcgJ family protein [Pseudomonas aeruginosa]|uniref:YcgJ family protein n=1 Tax=Pseudomonas aeruginosa TaxID=287 RepID=UPI0022EA1127|nr:YcgJ family protein [Pseudomonas aeruginosa]MDA3309526.1 YcgJ family protein [Pseudomonas aeruginosa]